MKFILLLFFSIPQLLFGQFTINGKIVDATNNKAIPYANIWIKNVNIGTTSSENGVFSLTTNKSGGIMNDTTPQIIGRYFPYELKNSSFRHIKSVIIYSRDSKKGKANLRIYSFDTSKVESIDELVHSNIIFETKISFSGKAKPLEIDLSDYNLIFPESGVLIGIEWLIIPQNRYKVTTNYTDSKIKKTKIMYAPNLGASINKKNNMYIYKEGMWIKPEKGHELPGYKYSNLYFNPAISLKLSD